MSPGDLLAFNLALLAAMISPGPALLVAVRTALGSGRSAGIAVGAGLATMAATWTLLALLGVETLFHLFPWAYALLKAGGAVYLMVIAFRMWTTARATIERDARPVRHAFRDGLLINLLNPKSVLFAAAVLVVVFPPGRSGLDNAIIVVNHLLVELSFYTLLAVAMSSEAATRRYLDAKPFLDRGAAIVLGALGVRLLLDR